MHDCEIPCEYVFEAKGLKDFNKQLAKLLGLT